MSLAEGVWQVDQVPAPPRARGKRVAIVGAGLAGLVTAMELADAGCAVTLYDTRPFAGGKVGSWVDRDGNHIEMGLHVFFGCYYDLFDVMAKVGAFKHLLLKEHTHQFVNKGGVKGELDFRLGAVGAPFNGLKAFAATTQLGIVDKVRNAMALGSSVIVKGLVDFDGAMKDIRALDDVSFSDWFLSKGGSRGSIDRLWNPIAYALGFIDCDSMSARCMLTIFQLFAARSEASVLRMLEGSPNDFLTGPILKYIEARGATLHLRRKVRQVKYETAGDGEIRVTGLEIADGANSTENVEADIYIAACDVGGAKRLIPAEWRERYAEFDKLYQLEPVPVVTVQLRFDGWVTELADQEKRRRTGEGKGYGLDNLLYSADTDFSCFADLAVTSPTDYYREGEGSLMQCVLTPGDPYMRRKDADVVARVLAQVQELFPSSRELTCTWSSVVKLGESLYREAPGKDKLRPQQKTSVDNFFLAGSYTYQDYIDSMEGAVKSGKLAAKAVLESVAADGVDG
ncbi:zeta-carotene desaturase [Chondrus crispus]|uniref:Zeta-carotene desaturase, chloroplastic/chromoplastic n=1 Tax=Chondrus crispus TaxID=2769 RepID=R7Q589_CHOCR|nr:zeta-carotene desaturase [Chondrus crispus]CDF33194.1 zeta-carotene desaturase [Chondrus crispus]|eukprot:XP_005712997.1 zeta-carotene desaturase [Chondrus crispus]